MFRFTSFREFMAQLQADQDARAQRIADEGSQETLIVRTGDDVTTEPSPNVITIRPDGNGGSVVEGDVPENATLTINGAPVTEAEPEAEEVSEPEVVAEDPADSNVITIRPDGNGGSVVEGDVPENATLTINDAPVAEEAPAPEVVAEPTPEVVAEPAPEVIVESAPEVVAEPAPLINVAETPEDTNVITVRPDGNGGTVVEGEVPENATLTIGEPTATPVDNGPVVNVTANTQQIDRNPQPDPEVPGEVLEGGEGTDFLTGTAGADVLNGNGGRDFLNGGDGDDILSGGAGRDRLDGGFGDDTFIFNEGDGRDRIANFQLLGDDDTLQLNVDGIDNFDDFIGSLSRVRDAGDAQAATFNFGGGDSLTITLESVESLTADDLIFV